MPIRPENLHRYPADWPDVRLRILQRAGYRCEFQGCKARHHGLGYWWEEKWVPLPRSLCDMGIDKPCTIATAEGPLKIIKIVLTIAHLDHQPENCDPSNLRAWCQKHHLAYDAVHHAVTRYRTRHQNANTLELFE